MSGEVSPGISVAFTLGRFARTQVLNPGCAACPSSLPKLWSLNFIVGYIILVIGCIFRIARSRAAATTTTTTLQEQIRMRTSSALRARLIAVLALAGAAFASPAHADEGSISFSVIKAGIGHWRLGGLGHAVLPRPAVPARDWRRQLRVHLRRVRDALSRHREQHPQPGGRLRRLCRGERGRGRRAGCAGDLLTNQHGAVLTL